MELACQLDLIAIGNRIRDNRKMKKMSQEKLAEIVYVSSNTISSIENGQQFFGIDKLDFMTKALGIDANELLYGKCENLKLYEQDEEIKKMLVNELFLLSNGMTVLELKRLVYGLQASMQVT